MSIEEREEQEEDEEGRRLIPRWMLRRTEMCKHKHGCYQNVVLSFYKVFVNSLAVKLALGNLLLLGKPAKLVESLRSWRNMKDHMRFALFLSLLNALYKLFLCVLRRFFKNDRVNAAVSGFLAGLLSALIETPGRRQLATILLISRVSDASLNMAEKRGVAKRVSYGEVGVWLVCNLFQQYLFGYEKDCVNHSQWKFMKKWSLTSVSEMSVIDNFHRTNLDQLKGCYPAH
uniref:Uncharacterized protein n=1 Tax=Strombidium rassoulzadegani TaxID=1082188 RepID=A0A7S3CN05_9SPIT|mmetsp:Transcript_17722/g.29993  ORF Transcript_17722/g.29993 Transcript_17722/m.29993 type:complete len:230 (+) Transcript_17722:322-1011(+)